MMELLNIGDNYLQYSTAPSFLLGLGFLRIDITSSEEVFVYIPSWPSKFLIATSPVFAGTIKNQLASNEPTCLTMIISFSFEKVTSIGSSSRLTVFFVIISVYGCCVSILI